MESAIFVNLDFRFQTIHCQCVVITQVIAGNAMQDVFVLHAAAWCWECGGDGNGIGEKKGMPFAVCR